MKLLILVSLLLVSFGSFSQQTDCPTGISCQSRLLEVRATTQGVNNLVNSPELLNNTVLPALDTYIDSDAFREQFLVDYPIEEPMGFPFAIEACEQKKSWNEDFADIDCNNSMLCSDTSISRDIRGQICNRLPCTFFLDDIEQCVPSDVMTMPTLIHYGDVSLREMDMDRIEGTSSFDGNTFRTCLQMNQMQVETSVQLELEPSEFVTYERIGLDNLVISLDGPREICVTAGIDLNSPEIITNFTIERRNGAQFVSDSMITQTMEGANVIGLQGYSPTALDTLKAQVFPTILRYFRSAIEGAIEETLSGHFQTSMATKLQEFKPQSGQAIQIDSEPDSFLSELSVSNMMVASYVDLLDCSIKKQQEVAIPQDHACFEEETYPFGGNSLSLREIPSVERAVERLEEQLNLYQNVTSQSLSDSLAGFESSLRALGKGNLFDQRIQPILDRIGLNQLQVGLQGGFELLPEFGNGTPTVSVAMRDFCDTENPSPFAGRSINNCPVQAYLDLNEVNKLFNEMYRHGRFCHRGSGDYSEQTPGSGCLFRMEDDEDGMSCYLNGPPSLNYNEESGGYKIILRTRGCYRGPVVFNWFDVRGDLNFEIDYTPAVCEGNQFCLTNGVNDWSVTEGTANFSREGGGLFSSIVRRTINKQLQTMLPSEMELPSLPGATPVEFEGRLDMGHGYFGACLRPRQ